MGGETRSGIRHLSGSYKGLSAMINTLIEWLTFAGVCVHVHTVYQVYLNCRIVGYTPRVRKLKRRNVIRVHTVVLHLATYPKF